MELSKEDLVKIMPNIPNELLDFLISLTSKKIKNFCHIEEIPEELKETQIQMCKDIYDLRYKNIINEQNNESSIIKSNIKNIKRGDTQIEFVEDAEKINNEKQILKELINSDNFIFNYESELIDFRRFRW